jgi:hypothetical protein
MISVVATISHIETIVHLHNRGYITQRYTYQEYHDNANTVLRHWDRLNTILRQTDTLKTFPTSTWPGATFMRRKELG